MTKQEIERRVDMWWTWHDADYSRNSATLGAAESRCRAWIRGESDDGPVIEASNCCLDCGSELHATDASGCPVSSKE